MEGLISEGLYNQNKKKCFKTSYSSCADYILIFIYLSTIYLPDSFKLSFKTS